MNKESIAIDHDNYVPCINYHINPPYLHCVECDYLDGETLDCKYVDKTYKDRLNRFINI